MAKFENGDHSKTRATPPVKGFPLQASCRDTIDEKCLVNLRLRLGHAPGATSALLILSNASAVSSPFVC